MYMYIYIYIYISLFSFCLSHTLSPPSFLFFSLAVWGQSCKHTPQRVGKDHELMDEDVVQVPPPSLSPPSSPRAVSLGFVLTR